MGGGSFCFWAGPWVLPIHQGRGPGGKEPQWLCLLFPGADVRRGRGHLPIHGREQCRLQPGQCLPGCDGIQSHPLFPWACPWGRLSPPLPFECPGNHCPPVGTRHQLCVAPPASGRWVWVDGQESLVKFLLLLVMPRPAWTSGTSFCSSAPFLSSAFLILAPAAPTPFSPWRPSWGSVPTLWWGGNGCSKGEGCWFPSFSASPSELVQRSKRLGAKAPFEHVFSSLEPATVYSIHVRVYSAEGASQDLASIHASSMGSGEQQLLQPCRAPGLGQTELPTSSSRFLCSPCCPQLPHQSAQCHLCAGLVGAATPAGVYPRLQSLRLLLASTVSSFPYTDLGEALSEIQLQAFSGHGDGKHSSHVVSRHDVPLATPGEWDLVAGWQAWGPSRPLP